MEKSSACSRFKILQQYCSRYTRQSSHDHKGKYPNPILNFTQSKLIPRNMSENKLAKRRKTYNAVSRFYRNPNLKKISCLDQNFLSFQGSSPCLKETSMSLAVGYTPLALNKSINNGVPFQRKTSRKQTYTQAVMKTENQLNHHRRNKSLNCTRAVSAFPGNRTGQMEERQNMTKRKVLHHDSHLHVSLKKAISVKPKVFIPTSRDSEFKGWDFIGNQFEDF